jgi:hypothetical protein
MILYIFDFQIAIAYKVLLMKVLGMEVTYSVSNDSYVLRVVERIYKSPTPST